MNKKIGFAGPFIGEFGWELFCWQGRLRWLKNNVFDEIYVIAGNANAYLYQDFAIVNDIPNYNRVCDYQENVSFIGNSKIVNYHPEFDRKTLHGFNFLEQDFVSYGQVNLESPRLYCVIHARKRLHRSESNWSQGNYQKVVDILTSNGLDVVSIGLMDYTHDLSNVIDKRNINTEETCNILGNAEFIFGVSSGPMHLASLCLCPQIVITDPINHKRYLEDWNPFNTNVMFTGDSWNPSVEECEKKIMELL